MDTCTNCGATLRPGAKFCTTCGTRLNEQSAANEGWGMPRTSPQEETQETSVLDAVAPPTSQSDSPSISQTPQRSIDSWNAAYGNDSASSTSDDPASRFISALDNDVKAVDEAKEDSATADDPASTWETPQSTFTPAPPSTWSYGAENVDEVDTEAESEESSESTSDWEAPSTWGDVLSSEEPEPESDTTESNNVDAAGFSEDGDDEVDHLSGDENIELAGSSSPELPPDEARGKAIALADELRRTIRMMGSAGETDHGAAMMALTEASLHIGDFSDVRGVLADVKDDPRDIQTLGELAGKADRIDELLKEHASLAEAIETAIKEMNGY